MLLETLWLGSTVVKSSFSSRCGEIFAAPSDLIRRSRSKKTHFTRCLRLGGVPQDILGGMLRQPGNSIELPAIPIERVCGGIKLLVQRIPN